MSAVPCDAGLAELSPEADVGHVPQISDLPRLDVLTASLEAVSSSSEAEESKSDSESDSDSNLDTAVGSLSLASAIAISASDASSEEKEEELPSDIIRRLVKQRKPSSLSVLGAAVKRLFIEKKKKEDGVPSLVIGGLYLGSIGAAANTDWLVAHSITHVLCVANGIKPKDPSKFKYMTVDITDSPESPLFEHFEDTSDFIEAALNSGGRVLVHCFAGMSRSVTIVSAYLMRCLRMTAIHALKHVCRKRTQARPNAGFILQLVKYQSKLGIRKLDFDPVTTVHYQHFIYAEKEDTTEKDKETEEEKTSGHHSAVSTTDVDSSAMGESTVSQQLDSSGTKDMSPTSPISPTPMESPTSTTVPLVTTKKAMADDMTAVSPKSSSGISPKCGMDLVSPSPSASSMAVPSAGHRHCSSSSISRLDELLQRKAKRLSVGCAQLDQIDGGGSERRPSLLTALARFRELKTHSRQSSLVEQLSLDVIGDATDEVSSGEEEEVLSEAEMSEDKLTHATM